MKRERPPRCETCNGYGKAEGECPGPGRMKSWPAAHDEHVDFSDLVEPVVAAILNTHTVTRKNKGKDVPYAGYALPGTAGTFGTCLHMTAEQMDYSDDEQGRSALSQLVGLAVTLGFEQQRRMMLGDKGEVFSPQMIGGRFRSDYAIGAAVEEAIEESGLDPDSPEARKIENGVRWKLRDLDGIEALQERHHERVEASLERSRALEAERRAAMTPEELAAHDAERKAMWDRIMGRQESDK